jgi:glycopeptide antibiotics resistance protein
LLALLCIGVASLIVYEGKRARQHIALLLLSEYTILIYCTTVIFRVVSISYRYNLKPFWSYEKPDLLLENIINVVVFVPIGFLLCVAFSHVRWWRVLLTGVSISVSIEMLQLLTT